MHGAWCTRAAMTYRFYWYMATRGWIKQIYNVAIIWLQLSACWLCHSVAKIMHSIYVFIMHCKDASQKPKIWSIAIYANNFMITRNEQFGVELLWVDLVLDPEAVAYEFYGWLLALCGWLAGLSRSRLSWASDGWLWLRKLTAAYGSLCPLRSRDCLQPLHWPMWCRCETHSLIETWSDDNSHKNYYGTRTFELLWTLLFLEL